MPRSKPQAVLSVSVNGHELRGVKRRDRWTFECPSWPELAETHAGAPSIAEIVCEFAARVVAVALVVTKGGR